MSQLLEKIDAMQYCRNMTISNQHLKDKLRNELEDQMQDYFKRGGKIKQLNRGETGFNKNGCAPMGGRRIKQSEKETTSAEIEAKNKVVCAKKGKKNGSKNDA